VDRRAFVAIVAVGFAAMRGRAEAQAPGKVSGVGYVGGAARQTEILVKTLRELGHVPGDNLYIDIVVVGSGAQWARYTDTIAKFMAQHVDIIVASNPASPSGWPCSHATAAELECT